MISYHEPALTDNDCHHSPFLLQLPFLIPISLTIINIILPREFFCELPPCLSRSSPVSPSWNDHGLALRNRNRNRVAARILGSRSSRLVPTEAHHNKAGVVIKNTFLEVRGTETSVTTDSEFWEVQLAVPWMFRSHWWIESAGCSDVPPPNDSHDLRWEITSHRCMIGAEPEWFVACCPLRAREGDKLWDWKLY